MGTRREDPKAAAERLPHLDQAPAVRMRSSFHPEDLVRLPRDPQQVLAISSGKLI
jgi:hypothetical protein